MVRVVLGMAPVLRTFLMAVLLSFAITACVSEELQSDLRCMFSKDTAVSQADKATSVLETHDSDPGHGDVCRVFGGQVVSRSYHHNHIHHHVTSQSPSSA